MDNKYIKNKNYCIDCKKEIDYKFARYKSCAIKNSWEINPTSFSENPAYLLTSVISEKNINARLKFGFELLQD